MSFLEKNIENIIFNNLDGCKERGLHIRNLQILKMYRQLALGSSGIADLVIVGKEEYRQELVIQIIECKRNLINIATYTQALRYQLAIDRLLGQEGLYYTGQDLVLYEKILIGQTIDDRGDFHDLVCNDPNTSSFTYEYGLNGVTFHFVESFLTLSRRASVVGKEHTTFRKDLCGFVEKQHRVPVEQPDHTDFFRQVAESEPLLMLQ